MSAASHQGTFECPRSDAITHTQPSNVGDHTSSRASTGAHEGCSRREACFCVFSFYRVSRFSLLASRFDGSPSVHRKRRLVRLRRALVPPQASDTDGEPLSRLRELRETFSIPPPCSLPSRLSRAAPTEPTEPARSRSEIAAEARTAWGVSRSTALRLRFLLLAP